MLTYIFYDIYIRYRTDRRKLRSETSDNMDSWKSRGGKSQRGEEKKRERQVRQKVGKFTIHCVLPMIGGSRGSKSRLAKAAGAEPAGQMRDEKLHAVVARSTFRSHNVQNTAFSDHFGSSDVEKVHAVVARSTFPSQNVTEHTTFSALLEVQRLKKCTPLWREAHFQVKMHKNTTCTDHFWKFRCRKSAH